MCKKFDYVNNNKNIFGIHNKNYGEDYVYFISQGVLHIVNVLIVIVRLLLGGGLEGFHIYFTKSIHNHDFDVKQVMLSLMCKEEISEKTKGE
ncbi:MAG: hypothetical protein K0R00_1048 [Herbinix sp.]|nr:hypothetical protein [Herbinix sp.]